jgi:hypothetical protein
MIMTRHFCHQPRPTYQHTEVAVAHESLTMAHEPLAVTAIDRLAL